MCEEIHTVSQLFGPNTYYQMYSFSWFDSYVSSFIFQVQALQAPKSKNYLLIVIILGFGLVSQRDQNPIRCLW